MWLEVGSEVSLGQGGMMPLDSSQGVWTAGDAAYDLVSGSLS